MGGLENSIQDPAGVPFFFFGLQLCKKSIVAGLSPLPKPFRHSREGGNPILVVPKLAVFVFLAIFLKKKWDSRLRGNDGGTLEVWERNAKLE